MSDHDLFGRFVVLHLSEGFAVLRDGNAVSPGRVLVDANITQVLQNHVLEKMLYIHVLRFASLLDDVQCKIRKSRKKVKSRTTAYQSYIVLYGLHCVGYLGRFKSFGTR